jgi:hypothetical protein
MEIREYHAPIGKCIDVWGFNLTSEAANISITHVICHNEQNIGPGIFLPFVMLFPLPVTRDKK